MTKLFGGLVLRVTAIVTVDGFIIFLQQMQLGRMLSVTMTGFVNATRGINQLEKVNVYLVSIGLKCFIINYLFGLQSKSPEM